MPHELIFRLQPDISSFTKKELGDYSEELANYIYHHYYQHQIVASNLTTPYGEIDLITQDDQSLYIIEVKSFRNPNYGLAISKWQSYQKRHLTQTIRYLIAIGVITSPDLLQVELLAFDFSEQNRVRSKRYSHISISLSV